MEDMSSDGTWRRRDMKTLKQQLPYPYNQDLSKILVGLNRRTPFARRRLANDPVTAAYLATAVRLIQRHLGPGANRAATNPDDHDSIERPVLSFLSQRAVAAEAEGDSVIRDAIADRRGEVGPVWRQWCEEFLQSRGLRIRPGVTIEDCVVLLSALADGLAMRALADPSTRALDRDGRPSLLGLGALALIAGCLDRTDRDDSRSLEQAVYALLGAPPASAERGMA